MITEQVEDTGGVGCVCEGRGGGRYRKKVVGMGVEDGEGVRRHQVQACRVGWCVMAQ